MATSSLDMEHVRRLVVAPRLVRSMTVSMLLHALAMTLIFALPESAPGSQAELEPIAAELHRLVRLPERLEPPAVAPARAESIPVPAPAAIDADSKTETSAPIRAEPTPRKSSLKPRRPTERTSGLIATRSARADVAPPPEPQSTAPRPGRPEPSRPSSALLASSLFSTAPKHASPAPTGVAPGKSVPSTLPGTGHRTATSKPKAAQLGALRSGYLGRLRPHLQRQYYYPKIAKRLGQQGRVLVAVLIDAQGRVLSVKLERPCAHAQLNRAALKAVRALGNLPKPPRELLRDGRMKVVVPMAYTLR